MAMITPVIGGIKSGAFEDYRYRREDSPRFTLALRAGGSGIITKASSFLKSARTTRALVFVDGQTFLPPNGHY